MKKYHKTIILVCDVRGCYDVFNSMKEVIGHQKDDHNIEYETSGAGGSL